MKTIIFFTFLFLHGQLLLAQNMSEISDNGFLFPRISLLNTADTSVSKSPKIGQIIYNTNEQISGVGAAQSGYYVWQSSSWKKINSTMPAGTIVLSESETNLNLSSKGFKFLYNINVGSPSQTFYLFQKK
jgi:hypothetical protein